MLTILDNIYKYFVTVGLLITAPFLMLPDQLNILLRYIYYLLCYYTIPKGLVF